MTIELNISNVIVSPELNAAQITITPVFSSGQGITPKEREKLAGIEENANNYTHPDTHPSSILDVVDVVNGASNKFLNERGEMVAVAHESLTDKNSEAAFQHVDTTTTKPALVSADMVAIKDSVTGKMVLTPKGNLQTDLTTVNQTITNLQNNKANKVQESWVTPTLLNGWRSTFSVNGISFRKDNFGNVILRGSISDGDTTSNVLAFTLPVGYRPLAPFLVGIVAADIFAEVRIDVDGSVRLLKSQKVWTSLDGVIFPTT